MTRSHRYLLSPMEKLQYTPVGSVDVLPTAIEFEIDTQFKPDYLPRSAFINGEGDHLCSLDLRSTPSHYKLMAGY